VTVYPAIDLRGGRCVRLVQGEFDRETVFGDDPVAMARRWEAEGARWLHVIDLDGARAGHPVQTDLVRTICRAVSIPVQVGGGLRDQAAVAAVLEAGAARAVVGTIAARDPERCAAVCRANPGRVAVGIDARDGRVRVSGWAEAESVDPVALAARLAHMGAAAIIYTDIGKDGTEQGPNLEATRDVARATPLPVIASGGVGSLVDVRAVKQLATDGIEGIIIGRAIYAGKFALRDALAIASGH